MTASRTRELVQNAVEVLRQAWLAGDQHGETILLFSVKVLWRVESPLVENAGWRRRQPHVSVTSKTARYKRQERQLVHAASLHGILVPVWTRSKQLA